MQDLVRKKVEFFFYLQQNCEKYNVVLNQSLFRQWQEYLDNLLDEENEKKLFYAFVTLLCVNKRSSKDATSTPTKIAKDFKQSSLCRSLSRFTKITNEKSNADVKLTNKDAKKFEQLTKFEQFLKKESKTETTTPQSKKKSGNCFPFF